MNSQSKYLKNKKYLNSQVIILLIPQYLSYNDMLKITTRFYFSDQNESKMNTHKI